MSSIERIRLKTIVLIRLYSSDRLKKPNVARERLTRATIDKGLLTGVLAGVRRFERKKDETDYPQDGIPLLLLETWQEFAHLLRHWTALGRIDDIGQSDLRPRQPHAPVL